MFEAVLHPYKKLNVYKLPCLKIDQQRYVDVKYLVLHIDMMQYLINKKLDKNYCIPMSMYDLPDQICEIYNFMQDKLYRIEYDQHYVNTLRLFLFCENMKIVKDEYEYKLLKDSHSFPIENCYELITLVKNEIKAMLYEECFYHYTEDLSYQLIHKLSQLHSLDEVYQLALKDETICMSINMPLLHLYLHYEHIPALKQDDFLIQLYNQIQFDS